MAIKSLRHAAAAISLSLAFLIAPSMTSTAVAEPAVTDWVPVGETPLEVALDPSTGTVYSTNSTSNTVSIIQGVP